MANRTRNIVIAAVAFLGLMFLVARRTISKITYSAGGFRVHRISFSEVEFRVYMTVTNQSDIPAPISAFIGQLLYSWPSKPAAPSVLGELRLMQPRELPGFGSVELEFSMTSGLLGSAWELLNILTDGNPTDLGKISYKNIDPKRMAIIGTLKVGTLPVDIKTTLAS